MKLVYIANTRLPSEKAMGYYISKQCEAFAENGAVVNLLYPRRRQYDPSMVGLSVHEYYGVAPIFTARALPNVDIFRIQRIVPSVLFPAFVLGHGLGWGLYGALAARQEEADLYCTPSLMVAFWLLRLNLPTAYDSHSLPRRIQRVPLRRIARGNHLRLAVTVTSALREELVQIGFPTDKVSVLPMGADLSHFQGLPDKAECRKRLGLPQGRTILGYVGRFQTMYKEKGIPEMVKAMALLQDVNGSEPLLLCVGGPMEPVSSYRNLARRIGLPDHRLQFMDRVPNREVAIWMRAFDIALAPFPTGDHYTHYISPLKVFEYMAAGLPILATDLPSLREVLRHGENAWMVAPGSPEALSKGIIRLTGDRALQQSLADQAREDVKSFEWKRRASRILDLASNKQHD